MHPTPLRGAARSRTIQGIPQPGSTARVLANPERKFFLDGNDWTGLVPLVTKLFLDPATGRNALVFAGIGPSGWTGRICADVARTLALSVTGSVCVISANAANLSLADRLQVRKSPGLLNRNFGPRTVTDFTQRLTRRNLWGMARGSIEDFDDEHVRLEAMYVALREVCATFDYTIIEAPTVCPFSETTMIDRLAWAFRDICLVRRPSDLFWLPVVGSGKQEAQRLRQVLSQKRFRSSAIVLSGTDGTPSSGEVGVRVAEGLAETIDGDVCFVDGNLRSPYLGQHFGIDSDNGLVQAVRQRGSVREFAQPLKPGNLWFVDLGLSINGLGLKDTRDRLELVIDEAKSEFDYVVVEAPPVPTSIETLSLGRLTDGVVLVIEAEETRRDLAARSKQTLEGAGVNVLGAVLAESGSLKFAGAFGPPVQTPYKHESPHFAHER